MTITIQNEHQERAAREAAEALRALCYTRIDDVTRCSEATARCESLALRLEGAARAGVLAVRDRLGMLTAAELRGLAAAWDEAALA